MAMRKKVPATDASKHDHGAEGLLPVLVTGMRNEESRRHVFRYVAECATSRVLQFGDSTIIAEWFNRLAEGESPLDVFGYAEHGRPRGKTAKREPMSNGQEPDDIDIAWIVQRNLDAGGKPGEVYEGVAKAFGMERRTVANIYSRNKRHLPKPLP